MNPRLGWLLPLMLCMVCCKAQQFATFDGPAYPPPTYQSMTKNPQLQDGMQQARTKLQSLLGKDNKTSAMILVRSTTDDSPLFSFAWQSTVTPNSSITADTVFRIGSVSKVFTVFALLMQDGFTHFDDLVTDHVPELRCESGTVGPCPSVIAWDQITLGSLAGQLAGVFRDYNAADLASLNIDWPAMGLPPLNASEVPVCAANETSPPCTRKQFFDGIKARPPVFQPYATPAYSNAAFRILAYAIASIAGQPFEVLFHELFQDKLGLASTSLLAPPERYGAVVPGDASWSQNLGDESPTGGMYSSANDLTSFATSILSNRLLAPQITRRWLKPTSFTARLELSVGMPWEIHRAALSLPGNRIVDLYAKSGSIGLYASELILIPDYNVSIAVLTVGESVGVVDSCTNIVLDALLPRGEMVAAAGALEMFGGVYTTSQPPSRLQIGSDGGPGLVIQSWTSNGSDIIHAAAAYAESTGGGKLTSIRLFPAISSSPDEVVFRSVFETTGPGQTEGIFRSNDGPWASVDQLVYGQEALDRFVFAIDADGQATTVSNDGLRSTLHKE